MKAIFPPRSADCTLASFPFQARGSRKSKCKTWKTKTSRKDAHRLQEDGERKKWPNDDLSCG